MPVHLDVAVTQRLAEPIETATYYLVAEALTHTAKYAHASTAGSELVGLNDRVAALGGRLWLHSPPGAGTTLRAELPLRQSIGQAPTI